MLNMLRIVVNNDINTMMATVIYNVSVMSIDIMRGHHYHDLCNQQYALQFG